MRAMKDSGIEWIGKIPKEWKVSRLRFLGKLNAGGVDKKVNDGEPLFHSIHYLDVYHGSLKELYKNESYLIVSASEYKQTNCCLHIGDVLFTSSSETPADIGHSAVIAEDMPDILFGYHLIRFRPTEKFDLHFEKFLFGSYYVRKWFEYRSVGMTRYGLAGIDYSDTRLVIPPCNIQTKISSFLDSKCSKIDEYLSRQQLVIEKLKEYKQSVITEAVTKGLDPDVSMKDSGVEWIGKTPDTWKLRRVKYLFRLRNERNYLPLNEVNLLSLYADAGVFPHGELEEKGNKAVTAEGYKKVYPNDIVVNIILAWMGSIGMSNYSGVTSPAYDIYEPLEGTISKFYHYYFRTKGFSGECYKVGRGIMEMRWRTYSAEFMSIKVCLPSIEEQHQIASYLDTKCAAIDAAIKRKQELIDKMTEYKKSLIYEAVTGKMEV